MHRPEELLRSTSATDTLYHPSIDRWPGPYPRTHAGSDMRDRLDASDLEVPRGTHPASTVIGPTASSQQGREADPTLEALAHRCTLGDMRAFEELYSRTAPKLLAVALRILRRRDLAEDALQDSYVNIWKHIGAYVSGKSAPMTWMTTIVRNRSLDLLRRPQWENVADNYDAIAEIVPDEQPGPDALHESRSRSTALHACLGELPRVQRQIVVMAYLHGLTGAELANRLEMPLSTVKSALRRSLPKLAKCLDACPGACTAQLHDE